MSKEFQIRDGNLIASFDLENEDGDIGFCKLLKVSHGVADEIGMFVDYVATNKIIKDQSKKIADLEAKLAESEEKNNMLEEHKFYSDNIIQAYADKCKNYEQQLAEKEKEIESLKDNWNVLCDYLGDCVIKYDDGDLNGIYAEVLDKVNILKRYDYKRYQDKISFCVEQLEKFRDIMEKLNENNNGYIIRFNSMRDREKFHEALDNQIEKLKKEMK